MIGFEKAGYLTNNTIFCQELSPMPTIFIHSTWCTINMAAPTLHNLILTVAVFNADLRNLGILREGRIVGNVT